MKILIVDDEALARTRLKLLLSEIPDMYVIGEANNVQTALIAQHKYQPDVILLDICMGDDVGFVAAQSFQSLKPPPAVIFITAHSHYALDAFKVGAQGYLTKPVRREALEQALHRLIQPTRVQNISIVPQPPLTTPIETGAAAIKIEVKIGNKHLYIPLNEVRYFRAEGRYVAICHLKGEALLETTLHDVETQYQAYFTRVHRKLLASLAHIERLEHTEQGVSIVFCDYPERIMVSRRLVTPLRELIKNNPLVQANHSGGT